MATKKNFSWANMWSSISKIMKKLIVIFAWLQTVVRINVLNILKEVCFEISFWTSTIIFFFSPKISNIFLVTNLKKCAIFAWSSTKFDLLDYLYFDFYEKFEKKISVINFLVHARDHVSNFTMFSETFWWISLCFMQERFINFMVLSLWLFKEFCDFCKIIFDFLQNKLVNYLLFSLPPSYTHNNKKKGWIFEICKNFL